MNSEKLANWLQIVGNLGILAGLVLVAVEINQNTATIQGSAYQDWVAANLELNMAANEPTLSRLCVLGICYSTLIRIFPGVRAGLTLNLSVP